MSKQEWKAYETALLRGFWNSRHTQFEGDYRPLSEYQAHLRKLIRNQIHILRTYHC